MNANAMLSATAILALAHPAEAQSVPVMVPAWDKDLDPALPDFDPWRNAMTSAASGSVAGA